MGKLREMLDEAKTLDDVYKIYESEEYKNASPMDGIMASQVLFAKAIRFKIGDNEKRLDDIEKRIANLEEKQEV